MTLKQISVTMPEILLEASKEYSEEYGYKNIQEMILDMLRKKVILENVERYKEIEEKMKKGVGKRFTQKGAIKYLKSM